MLRVGQVASFDPEVGIGRVATDIGDEWMFHCTTIAGGSRTIAVGTIVAFDVRAGGPGRWEAFEVTPCADGIDPITG